jgi:methenyltetrahydrofolate cyclohydrolase
VGTGPEHAPGGAGAYVESDQTMESTNHRWSIEELGVEVARTDRYAGGGAVAAMSLVGAAATAELVFQLSAGRKNIEPQERASLDAAVELCGRLRQIFQHAIDEDIASLTELMDAQSQLRKARKAEGEVPDKLEVRSRDAVEAAIETPLRVARDAKRLLRTIDELQHLSRPFTASDLGAAAATSFGAITSLLLMAEVNLGMIDSEEEATRIAQEIEDLYSQSEEQANNVVARTRSVIR